MSDEYANQMDYYVNWPGRTKADVDREYAAIDESEWPEHKRPVPRPIFDEDLIPDATSNRGPVSEIWAEMDEVIMGLDVLDAYERWILPQKPQKIVGRRHEIPIRCPLPSHNDADPSASLNPDKGVWKCHSCDAAGDKFDLAGIHFGYGLSEIRGPAFAELKRQMAEDLGWREAGGPKDNPRLVKTTPGAENETLKALQTAPEPPPEPTHVAAVAADREPEPVDQRKLSIPIDWRSILKNPSPMRAGMEEMSQTDIPDEYSFWTIMQAMALAGGKQLESPGAPTIYPTLYVLLVGASSTGKSRCVAVIERAIREALPFGRGDAYPKGVLVAGAPGSGEGIHTAMAPPVEATEVDENGVEFNVARGVKALWNIKEFAEFIKRKNRLGDTTSEIFMNMYDCDPVVQLQLRKGPDELHDPFACVVSSLQPRMINDYIDRRDVWSGLVNRWIPAWAIDKRPQISNVYIPDLSAFVDGLRDAQKWADQAKRVIVMSADAERRWDQFYFDHIHPLASDGDDPMAAMWGRNYLHFRKIMAVMCLNERRTDVDLELLERVLSLWPYIQECFKLTTGRIESSEHNELAERILAVLQRHPEGHTAGHLRRDVGNGRSIDLKEWASAIRTLEQGGLIRQEAHQNAKGGPRTMRIALVH
jgi:hypothetical protein